jgi:hypothetical protein
MVKLIKLFGIGLIVILSSLVLFPSVSAAGKFFTYDAMLDLQYDSDVINTAVFQPDGPSVSIPITVTYQVYVPEAFLSQMIWRIIFLQTFIVMNAQVKLSVVNPPNWAAISLATASVYIPIDSSPMVGKTALQIAAHKDAPAQGFSLRVMAQTDPVLNNHVQSKEAYVDIQFQPGYIPLINVYTETPNVIVSPQETVNFPIKITNLGNKESIVRARIVDAPDGWATLLPQSQIVIPSKNEAGENDELLTFSVTPPYGLGWHNDLETITLEFTPEFSPPSGASNTSAFIGTPVQFQVTLRNRGFSTPGFEFLFLIIAIGLIVLLAKKTKKF